VSANRVLLVPSFTELEWAIRPRLEEWAEVATFDPAGVGDQEFAGPIDTDPARAVDLLSAWRAATVDIALSEVDRRAWSGFVLVADSYGAATAVRIARARPESVLGLAFGHASLSHTTSGPRPPVRPAIWEAMEQLIEGGREAFVRYGIAQMTQGAISDERAAEMLARFPDLGLASAVVRAFAADPEPIGDDLAALDLPLLLAKHEGCLARTDEGFEDIVAAFPEARTVICPEACPSSPALADALRSFADGLAVA
jgi:pimeloyl-ACP methyl ester carboxylesterase